MNFLRILALISMLIAVASCTYYAFDYFKNESKKQWWENIMAVVYPPLLAGLTIFTFTVRRDELDGVIGLLMYILVSLYLSAIFIKSVFERREKNAKKKFDDRMHEEYYRLERTKNISRS